MWHAGDNDMGASLSELQIPGPREPVLDQATGEKLAQHPLDDAPQRAVRARESLGPEAQQILDVLADKPIEGRFLRPSRSVESNEHFSSCMPTSMAVGRSSTSTSKWTTVLGVTVPRVFVQRMKTKWGSCNPPGGTIRLNTELARKPPECLEYLVVHELTHLREPTHSPRFVALMDQFLPAWRSVRQTLNRLPVRHEDWEY
jgi:hypothetical protein